jgi:hypothetical protein
MNLDPNGYPIPDPNAPKTRLGKVAAVLFAIVFAVVFIIGCVSLFALILHAAGVLS